MNWLRQKKTILVALWLLAAATSGVCKAFPPKREFRAAWIATVGNIDWPSKQGLPSYQQQQEFIRHLETLKSIGCNAVIVQIRPAADAFYPSSIEPWSRYLTGRQGEPPFPLYDPLKFMIEETHKRQMEFHAWFNPFRALVDSKKNPNPPGHVTRTHPGWIISYGGKSYIDPGIPEARDYVMKVIMDVVKRYDIDAVHLDDYFYPYRVGSTDFPDAGSYRKYGAEFANKADWRRNNVNLFVSLLAVKIKDEKRYVKFGISPFGVYRKNYEELYADVTLWLQKGWIDYVLPQLYWEHGHKVAPFEDLLPWWEANSYGRHVYYGLGLYRMVNASAGPWKGTGELLSQIKDIRSLGRNPGFSLYSLSCLGKVNCSIADSLEKVYDQTLALVPAMKWIDSIPPMPPGEGRAIPSAQGTLLKWEQPQGGEDAVHYAVYRFVNNEPVNMERGDKLVSIQEGTEFLDADANRYQKCTYIITALDRLWNESRGITVAPPAE